QRRRRHDGRRGQQLDGDGGHGRTGRQRRHDGRRGQQRDGDGGHRRQRGDDRNRRQRWNDRRRGHDGRRRHDGSGRARWNDRDRGPRRNDGRRRTRRDDGDGGHDGNRRYDGRRGNDRRGRLQQSTGSGSACRLGVAQRQHDRRRQRDAADRDHAAAVHDRRHGQHRGGYLRERQAGGGAR